MSFDWFDFLVVADTLATVPDEGSQRSAISRAYYAIYNLALERIETEQGPQYIKGERHRALWAAFQASPYRECKAIGDIGDQLRRRRTNADYIKTMPKSASLVPNTIDEARKVADWLKGLKAERLPDRIDRATVYPPFCRTSIPCTLRARR